ncbi:hypothetical protein C8E03_11811 [Lachnotalea glycerini]|jgi:hypothetical protein|uniref:Uncharacterized protein n=1 Tax=Lachnotalea glycerini TaxID=1763509 RepID=A0A255IBF6_9FIRM|nr:DUF6323 family protein [Lachnotalea glycerini]OYO51521.1 hypothetical protein CG709_19245 [Lachnotalea glycerini]PXV85304.1 hypothetical protein C8E03_11811 [Lachnotalea glycerini]RDY29872.1 hypothetical protein CG710_017560 [Lachnotalea glycerini]
MEEKQLFELMMSNGKEQLQKVIKCNSYTNKFGLSLSSKEALQLLDSRKNSLRQEERVEFGEGILSKIIYEFCDSPFIYQDNYVDTLEGLQEIFYIYKNEALDEVTDDELLSYMKECFNGKCQGDLDYLEGSCLDAFCRKIRSEGIGFIGAGEEENEI